MDTQQVITLILIGIAALYLVRQFVRSLRAALSNKPGCGNGCGKCGLAAPSEKHAATPRQSKIIPLQDVRSISKSRDASPK